MQPFLTAFYYIFGIYIIDNNLKTKYNLNMKYLKLFTNHSEYEDFVDDGTMLRPNVSHCVQEEEVHYNPLSDPRLVIKYNATDASVPTLLFSYYPGDNMTAALMFDKVEIDGVEVSIADIDTAEGLYQFSVGEHTVKYTLKDPTSIGNYAFNGCGGITSVAIPDSVISIGEEAFVGCSGLTSVTIGNSVTTIGNSAFRDCRGLTSVVIGNSVDSIGDYAFRYCTGLTSVVIPNSVTSIGNYAFRGCSGLTSVTISNSVTSIGDRTFNGCSSLTSVTIPNSVTYIGEYAFYQCTGLTSLTLGNSVTTIGYQAFAYCGITSVEIPNSVESIGNYAFCCPLDSATIAAVSAINPNASNCPGIS